MAKAFISIAGKVGVKWELVEFSGATGTESRGIVDVVAIRKDHHKIEDFKRGDLFEIVLIQIKGGSAARPSKDDINPYFPDKDGSRVKSLYNRNRDFQRRI